MKNSTGIIQLSQAEEYAPYGVAGKRFSYRLAYARATETQAADNIGQDYLTLCESEEVFIFVLCDGVSQSFYGDLAAKYLGDALLPWLQELPDTLTDAESFQAALHDALYALTATGTEQVQQVALPSDLPDILREVLEEKRSLGSEAMFVCGRIDLPHVEFPQGRVLLAWLGDARLRVWCGKRELKLPGEFETKQRWSTRRGPVASVPHVYAAPVHHNETAITHLMAYSDGLTALDTWDNLPSSEELDALIAQAEASPVSDDISFLGLQLTLDREPPKTTTPISVLSPQIKIEAEDQGQVTETESVRVHTDTHRPPAQQREFGQSTREDSTETQQTSAPGPMLVDPIPAREPSMKAQKRNRQFLGIALAFLFMVCVIAVGLSLPPGDPLYQSLFSKSTPPSLIGNLTPTLTEETVPAPPATDSPTTTSAPTATHTATPTPDPTATHTATVTPTPSPTAMVTPTLTATLTATPTLSPTTTSTITVSPTSTLTVTPVLSPTLIATPVTILHTPTPTVSLTLAPPE